LVSGQETKPVIKPLTKETINIIDNYDLYIVLLKSEEFENRKE